MPTTKKTSTKTKKQQLYSFSKQERLLYDEIIDLLEFKINHKDNSKLEFNGIPIIINNKYLVRMCKKSDDLDPSKYTPFKPLKNMKHLQFLLDYIHENEYEYAEFNINKDMDDNGNKIIIVSLYDPESEEVLAVSNKSYSEIEGKFKCLYAYFYGEEYLDKLSNDIRMIRKYDAKYRTLVKPKRRLVKK